MQMVHIKILNQMVALIKALIDTVKGFSFENVDK